MNEDAGVREDLRAFGSASERGLPPVEEAVQRARLGAGRRPVAGREWLMRGMQTVGRWPWLATALGAVGIAVVLLVVPVSYERTTGHEVELSLAKAGLAPAQLLPLVRELKAALGAERVEVREDGGTTVLAAFVPARSGSAARAAQAFARELAAKGYKAAASVRAVKERVSGSVYAFARDQVITIATDGKSAPQLEAEIRQRLAEAGIPDATVSVTDEGAGKRQVKVEVARDGVAAGAVPQETAPRLVLTKNGAPLAGEGLEVRVLRRKTAAGNALAVEVRNGARTVTAEVADPEALGDAGVAREIERQLAAAGFPVTVTVSGGRIEITKK